ncbi:VanZ family protein [Paenibacillus alginolyticus]|uniref:VanZ family protein n=1 Tax=Paenibacillus alginolyticus TaxID=59839 RepID=UPI00056142D9|nr:VanZ family protein [Paenibacillus alginolyticus]MCY9666496.1 VanZ family protein [Paenibacillus alginolyticus]
MKKNLIIYLIMRFVIFLYSFLLIKVTLFKYSLRDIKRHFSMDYTWENLIKNSNFIPFKTIRLFLEAEYLVNSAKNIIGNVVIFVPFGFLFPLFFSKLKVGPLFCIALATSLLIEFVQLFALLGSFDVDDIILNIFGAILGFIAFFLLEKMNILHHFAKR